MEQSKQGTTKEIKKAERMMTWEEKNDSSLREKYGWKKLEEYATTQKEARKEVLELQEAFPRMKGIKIDDILDGAGSFCMNTAEFTRLAIALQYNPSVKNLYLTLSSSSGNSNTRLWADEPKLDKDDRPDWGENYAIAIARTYDELNKEMMDMALNFPKTKSERSTSRFQEFILKKGK